MRLKATLVLTLIVGWVLGPAVSPHLRTVGAVPNKFDIGSGGAATITGSLGGFVNSNASLLSDLVVNVNFGELSPINNTGVGGIPLVKVVVPIAIRSTAAYQVTISVSPSGTLSADPDAVQFTDVGFGIRNFRPLGGHSTSCAGNSTIVSPLNNDPAQSVGLNANGRAVYTSTIKSIPASGIVIFGPQLSVFTNVPDFKRDTDNGWIFDAIVTIAPQYYSPGGMGGVVLSFNISAATVCSCPCA